jgi:hypothetical protein
MERYNLQWLPGNLETWIGQRFLSPILDIEGGWEYWIQIDFPAWLDVYSNTQYDFRREQPIPGGRLDWLINSQVQPAAPGAIEIKAQTHKYQTSAFVQAVLADVAKLQNLGPGYATRFMLAAVIDQNAYDALVQNHGFFPLTQVQGIAFVGRSV